VHWLKVWQVFLNYHSKHSIIPVFQLQTEGGDPIQHGCVDAFDEIWWEEESLLPDCYFR